MGEIHAQDVVAAARSIEQVAAAVRREIPDEVAGIAAALPGATSGAAGQTLAHTWTAAYTAWVADAETQGAAMRASAQAWTSTNQAVTSRLGGLGPRAV